LYAKRYELLVLVEDSMGESLSSSSTGSIEGVSSATGLQTSLNNFFTSWQGLTDRPDSLIARENVINRSRNLAADVQAVYNRVLDVKNGIFEQSVSVSNDINNLSKQIADLNSQIAKIEVGGDSKANDLRDRRQELMENLSKLVNITVTQDPNNNTMLNVALTDSPAILLVNGGNGAGAGAGPLASYRLDAVALNPMTSNVDVNGTFNRATNSIIQIVANNSVAPPAFVAGFPPPGTLVTPLEGELGAGLIVANTDIGSGHAVVASPDSLVEKLNRFANQLITLVNEIHNPTAVAPPETFTLDGTPTDGTATYDLYSGTNALTIALNLTDPNLLAAARNETGTNFPGSLDATNAQRIAGLRDNTNLGLAYRQAVADVGSRAQQSERNQSAQTLIQRQVLKQRESVSGISVDEEMTNMISYQRAFEASARFMNVISELMAAVIGITR
jgi:flagellar hook-associated protein 1 FlgK